MECSKLEKAEAWMEQMKKDVLLPDLWGEGLRVEARLEKTKIFCGHLCRCCCADRRAVF